MRMGVSPNSSFNPSYELCEQFTSLLSKASRMCLTSMLREPEDKARTAGSSSMSSSILSSPGLPGTNEGQELASERCAALCPALPCHVSQNQLPPTLLLSHMELGPYVAAGSYGNVRAARISGIIVAYKEFKPSLLASNMPLFMAEIERQWSLRHEEHIVRMFHMVVDDQETVLGFTMEWMAEGTLSDRADRDGGLDPRELTLLGEQICRGIMTCHRRNLIHRDIKPANILLTRNNKGELIGKIADFGMCLIVPEGHDHVVLEPSKPCGTYIYMAPENLMRPGDTTRQVCFKSDVWCLGATMWQMATGQTPHQQLMDRYGKVRLFERLRARKLRLWVPKHVAGTALERWFLLALTCMEQDPDHRPDVEDVEGLLGDILQQYYEERDGEECDQCEENDEGKENEQGDGSEVVDKEEEEADEQLEVGKEEEVQAACFMGMCEVDNDHAVIRDARMGGLEGSSERESSATPISSTPGVSPVESSFEIGSASSVQIATGNTTQITSSGSLQTSSAIMLEAPSAPTGTSDGPVPSPPVSDTCMQSASARVPFAPSPPPSGRVSTAITEVLHQLGPATADASQKSDLSAPAPHPQQPGVDSSEHQETVAAAAVVPQLANQRALAITSVPAWGVTMCLSVAALSFHACATAAACTSQAAISMAGWCQQASIQAASEVGLAATVKGQGYWQAACGFKAGGAVCGSWAGGLDCLARLHLWAANTVSSAAA